MKYLLFIVLLMAVVITAGCVSQNTTVNVITPQKTMVSIITIPTKVPTTISPDTTPPTTTQTVVGIANPASVNCKNLGGNTEIKKNADGSEYGMCTFANGTTCEEWALFRNEGCKLVWVDPALDKAWAENEIAAAQVPINNVDAIIGWFKGNTSTANDQQLSTIITKREVAVGYLSNANDNIADGKYPQARQKAQDAFLKANESYTEALARQKQVSSGWGIPFPNLGGSVFIVLGIVAVILVVVGVIIYRKRSQWDELG